MNMQKNRKKIEPATILKWDDKVVQLWFKHSKNERLCENERELYLWLAISRNNIYRTIIRNGRIVLMFWKNDTKAKTTSNQAIKLNPSSSIGYG